MEDFNKKWPKQTSHMPTEKAYAIMTPRSVTIPGDERSRTNPGHGYPEHTEHYWNVEMYYNEEEWKAEIKKRHESKYGNKNFVAYVMYPVKVDVSINVDVEANEQNINVMQKKCKHDYYLVKNAFWIPDMYIDGMKCSKCGKKKHIT